MKYVSTFSALIIGLAATFTVNSAAQQNNQDNNAIVAKVGGTDVTAADFEKKEAGDLLQARYTMYQSERKVLDQFIDKQLLETQAKKIRVDG